MKLERSWVSYGTQMGLRPAGNGRYRPLELVLQLAPLLPPTTNGDTSWRFSRKLQQQQQFTLKVPPCERKIAPEIVVIGPARVDCNGNTNTPVA